MAGIDLRPPGAWQAEQEAKERQAWLRKNDPGPPQPRCEECGAYACFGRGNFGRASDTIEWLCEKHAPDSLKRPGDFL